MVIEVWEIAVALVIVLAICFTFRAQFIKHYRTTIGCVAGAIIGRIAYAYISAFLGFYSPLIMIFSVIVGAFIFAGVSKDFFDRIFPEKPEGQNKNE